jgi:hypothetical protein
MKNIRKLIKEHLLLEKRVAQLTDNFNVTFGFDVLTSKHTRDRMNLGRSGLSDRVMSNSDVINIIEKYKRDIAENIINGHILDGDEFVIKDKESNIDCAILAQIVEDFYWTLFIKTIFPSSESFSLLVGDEQIVLSK